MGILSEKEEISLKAIIMAGGEGTRLRPISSGRPKPMTPLLGKPLLEHIITLLKEHGIVDICTTLRFLPEAVTEYFKDGTNLGVNLHHRVETTPLGTAGGVRACMDFIGDEDFLVISGDAACDFDLGELIDYHKKTSPAVTMALYSHPEPLPYGTVLTEPDGLVRRFIEKPSWDRVLTDYVNTGIYIISPEAMKLVPEGKMFDFAKDLFPLLMSRGMDIRALSLKGYWCDIGNPAAYLQCSMDALSGALRIETGLKKLPGYIYSGSALPRNAELIPPCLIGDGCVIEEGAVIGPQALIGRGSFIGSKSKIEHSVVDGATIGRGALVSGSVVCRNSYVPPKDTVSPGSIIAVEGAPLPETPKKADSRSARKSPEKTSVLPCENRARFMRVLSESLMEAGADFSDGLSLKSADGVVRISPAEDSSSIIIEADSSVPGGAARLITKYRQIAGALDVNE